MRNGAGPDVDLALAGVVARGEQALLDLVTATVDRHPTLSAALAGAEAGHRTHLALLAGAVPGSAAPTAAPTPAPTPAPIPAPTPAPTTTVPPGPGSAEGSPAVPTGRAAALSAVARAEQRHAAAGRASSVAAGSGPFARVLASMAAAAAQQASLLAATVPPSTPTPPGGRAAG